MTLAAIVAAAENNAIGKDNKLPWHLSDDLKFFKKTTMGKPMLMGRKTFESFGSKPLPGRLNIILSNGKPDLPEGVKLCHSLNDGIALLQHTDSDEGFIIGGGKVFEEAMPLLERIYMTRVHTTIEDADAFFPHMDHAHWKLAWEERHEKDEKHEYAFTFQKWERIKEI